MAEARGVLQRCDPFLLDPCGDSDPPECSDSAMRFNLYLTDSRRVQKVLLRQLSVLDSVLSLMEGLDSAQSLIAEPCQPQPVGGARNRWKSLKVENRSGTEETEAFLGSLQDKVQQVHSRRQTLTQLVQHLHSQKQQSGHLAKSLQKAQDALRLCDRQLTQLRVESEAASAQLINWQQVRDALQVDVSAAEGIIQINLLSFSHSELCVELRPRPSFILTSSQLEPVKLSVIWSHDDRFTLQVMEGTAGLVEDCMSGRQSELSAALLEVMQCYMGQAELLCEIQTLRSSFAIDWRPAQRLLIYLKSASRVCHLEVEEGYPGSGGVRLLSVQRDGRPLDTSELKPHKAALSLTDWLVFLCSSPVV